MKNKQPLWIANMSIFLYFYFYFSIFVNLNYPDQDVGLSKMSIIIFVIIIFFQGAVRIRNYSAFQNICMHFHFECSQHAKCSLSLPQQNCLTTNRAAATLKKHRFFQIKNKRLLINQIVPGSNEKPALSPVCPYKRTEGGRVRQICLRRIKAHRLHCTFFILIPT